jgi:hypothetical protein
MRYRSVTGTTVFTLLLVLTFASGLKAQEGAVTTVWQKMAIPQTAKCLHAQLFNRNGNFPGLEKKPPLKNIADMANLEEPGNSPIKVAAEIKQKEDKAPQKIKALKYLATIGCGGFCSEEQGKKIEAAFIDGMRDCTESVRLAAVEAVKDTIRARRKHQHRGNPNSALAVRLESCKKKLDVYKKFIPETVRDAVHHVSTSVQEHHGTVRPPDPCDSRCCCTPDIMAELAKLAYERKDSGCWYEPSAAVRRAAIQALEMCCPTCFEPIEILPDDGGEEPLIEEEGEEPAADVADPADAAEEAATDEAADSAGAETNPVEEDPAAEEAEDSEADPFEDAAAAELPPQPTFSDPSASAEPPGDSETMDVEVRLTDDETIEDPLVEFIAHDPTREPAEEAPVAEEPPAFDPEQAPLPAEPVGGVVEHYDVSKQLVHLSFDEGIVVPTGQEVEVYHRFLLGVSQVAILEVTEAAPGRAVARPLSGRTSKIARGDTVVGHFSLTR